MSATVLHLAPVEATSEAVPSPQPAVSQDGGGQRPRWAVVGGPWPWLLFRCLREAGPGTTDPVGSCYLGWIPAQSSLWMGERAEGGLNGNRSIPVIVGTPSTSHRYILSFPQLQALPGVTGRSWVGDPGPTQPRPAINNSLLPAKQPLCLLSQVRGRSHPWEPTMPPVLRQNRHLELFPGYPGADSPGSRFHFQVAHHQVVQEGCQGDHGSLDK